ncbi:putative Flavin-binding monooxygenase [Taphrina deformans PYCC 5710]|uniref:Flavin-binding monooxygenase n=1 Tax=Taphrina deformans (strain PYCC 5710 / ATCC 11124 / CBS 356.35 / IMI 108563 / JCM 9778 / NBRC 8474) TaxID=1097556 RepID=R4XCP3_TAPDE|nr:putative Flavin-binding monooxygenase [Taphrina deformans PYCC 5710]|eukprot:CCG81075.1 putative Flavin-binding monooxygenase [Taphrina deformans PYCC 5710]
MQSDFDLIIIGAGISGINAAQRIQTSAPGCDYTILEARDTLGGTWALFKYPGIRSDSDLFTFGFAWKPWSGSTRFANGQQITDYMTEAAQEYGIDKKIQYNQTVTALDWSSEKAIWSIKVDTAEGHRSLTAKFVILGTGYYNYHEPLKADVAGIQNFKGKVVYPQFWPEDLDYKNKKVVIVGSGATAITLLPNMADKAAKVTMLQRSPSYVMTLPNKVPKYPSWVPKLLVFSISYIRYLILPYIFVTFCRTFPNAARKMIRKRTMEELPSTLPHDPHFNPTYNPWEQRLCMSPDGDFFKSIRDGKANVVTGKIANMTRNSVQLDSGDSLEADIVVLATGLKLQMAGGAKITVDGTPINIGKKYIWRGVMLQDVPNCAFVIGYTSASWTLGADCTALVVCRLLKQLEQRNSRFVVARAKDGEALKEVSVLNLTSTYVKKAQSELPRASETGPWQARSNYFRDYLFAKFGALSADGLEYK